MIEVLEFIGIMIVSFVLAGAAILSVVAGVWLWEMVKDKVFE